MSLANIINKVMSKYTPNTKKIGRFIKEKDLGDVTFQLEELLPLIKPQTVVIGYVSEKAMTVAREVQTAIADLFPDTKIFLLPVERNDHGQNIKYTYEQSDGSVGFYYPGVSTTLLALPDLGLIVGESLTVLGFRPASLPASAAYVYGNISEERKAQLRKLDLDVEYPTEKMFVTRELCGKDVLRILVLHDGDQRNFKPNADLSKVTRRILLCNDNITVAVKKHEDLSYQSPSAELKRLLDGASWVVNVTEKETLVHRVIDNTIEQEARGFLFLD